MGFALALEPKLDVRGLQRDGDRVRWRGYICTPRRDFKSPLQLIDSKRSGSPAWIRTTIHGSKGRCPTIRRPGNAGEQKRISHQSTCLLSDPQRRSGPLQ